MNESENKSLHIEPYSLIRDIIRNLWVIILAALTGLMAVNIWNQSMHTPMYTSTATLLVNLKNSASYSYTNLSSSSEMAEIFTEVFVQPTMKQHAADYLGMSSFDGSVTSSVLDNTNIFTVSVISKSPEMSYNELCAILEIYPDISESVFSDSVIEIMRSPNLPISPSNTISDRYKSITVVLCAAAALLAIVYLSVSRDTVKDEYSFRQKIDSKLFGTVQYEKRDLKSVITKKKTSLLISNAYASFQFTENYNKIANKFEYLQRNDGAKVFLITSLAENEGKSTAAANIALALTNRGKKVLLLDMDFKKPAVYKIFDVKNSDTPDFASLLSGEAEFDNFSFYKYKNTNLDLALNFGCHNDYVNWIYSERIEDIFNSLRADADYDYVIIDTPPLSAAADVTHFLRLADKSFVVVRTDCVYAADINDALLSIKENCNNFEGCILNAVHKEFSMLGQLGLDETGYYGKYNSSYYGAYNYYSSNNTNNKS